MTRAPLTLSVAMAFALTARAEPGPQTSYATVPLADLMDLHKKVDRESVTVVEDLAIRGRFRQSLTMTVKGRATGTMPKQAFMTESESFRVSGCSGAALVQRESE